MKFRAVVKQCGNWWIGWLVDLPGVNGQERTRDELLESLRIGAEDMLATEVPDMRDAAMVMIEVADPDWYRPVPETRQDLPVAPSEGDLVRS
jgi:hypothetical protein